MNSNTTLLNRNRLMLLLMGLLLITALIPKQIAYADIGPKPQMEFKFNYPYDDQLSIISGELLECDQSDCADAAPLPTLGPQNFSCTKTDCTAMAYGFSKFHRLRITFSDGITRDSNVFGKRFFNARYQVAVGEHDLMVREQLGGLPPLQGILALGLAALILISLFMLTVFVLLILLIIREEQDKNNFQQSKAFYISSWVISLPLILLSLMISRALLLTILLELGVMQAYTSLRKKPHLSGLTVVLLINLLSQPPLWYALHNLISGNTWLPMVLGEIMIWLFEAMTLYLTQRKHYTLREALWLSLLLNAVSLLVGLLLPL